MDPLHLVSYFTPEVDGRFTALGLDTPRMRYLAGRAAALGPVGAGVVTATFYTFNPGTVAEIVPRAWHIASPADILAARVDGVDEALRRLLGDELVGSAEVVEAAALARRATEACTPEGRALYAAHAELEWPKAPHMVLWHAITLLREHRGDGHLAALLNHGLGGLAAIITDGATGNGLLAREETQALRGWSGEQWDVEAAALTERGLLDDDGVLTEAGRAVRAAVEEDTNTAAAEPYRALGVADSERLRRLCLPLSRVVLDAGVLPGGAGRQITAA
nr:hypothetical protein [Saccharothrix obliqua]